MAELFSQNPLLEINTSFSDYLNSHTSSYQSHVVGGKLDYAYDTDFAMRQKISSCNGWSKLYKGIVSTDMPNKVKRFFQSSDSATSVQYSKAYDAAKTCSERLQIGIPVILVRKSTGTPEIMALCGDGVENCIVMTEDIAEGCTHDELCYLIGCECGRLQNKHAAFNYAFTYPGISRGEKSADNVPIDSKSGTREINYALNSWILFGDITADRAGIICLDKPSDFSSVFAGIRKKGIPDSYNKVHMDFDEAEVKKLYETFHITPVRDLAIDDAITADKRRYIAGMEFTACEVVYLWRPDISSKDSHVGNKQALEIRCDIITRAENHS